MLEPTLDRVDWPLVLSIGRAVLYLVDDTDPSLRPLWEGDTVLGWEGDSRLRVYVCPKRATWELVRLEADGTYTSCSRFAEGTYPVAEMVGQWVLWLVTHDGRRGFDVLADQDRQEAKAEATRDAELTEKIAEDVQPRLAHALRKDGVDEVWGGRWSLAGLRKVGPTSPVPPQFAQEDGDT
jgi:hypothetical protein